MTANTIEEQKKTLCRQFQRAGAWGVSAFGCGLMGATVSAMHSSLVPLNVAFLLVAFLCYQAVKLYAKTQTDLAFAAAEHQTNPSKPSAPSGM